MASKLVTEPLTTLEGVMVGWGFSSSDKGL